MFINVDGYSPATRRVLHHLENNDHFYLQNSMEEISQALGYNKNYLSAVFAKETGWSIRDYINFHRVRVSTIFFFNWEVGVKEACQWLHFSSYSHFNRVFKRFAGITPSSFRKACLSLSAEERARIDREEPLLSYQIVPIDNLFAALLHLGQTMAEILEEKARNGSQMQTEEGM
jgi:AraC-like DNA-binding protein